MINKQKIETFDPDLWKAIQNEKIRQEEHIELIASENYTSEGVLELGFVEVSTVELGVDKVVNVNGVEGQLNIGTISVTANVFDFSAVANNFERRRTVHIHRLTTGLDRTVKVA